MGARHMSPVCRSILPPKRSLLQVPRLLFHLWLIHFAVSQVHRRLWSFDGAMHSKPIDKLPILQPPPIKSMLHMQEYLLWNLGQHQHRLGYHSCYDCGKFLSSLPWVLYQCGFVRKLYLMLFCFKVGFYRKMCWYDVKVTQLWSIWCH